jgi:hypothetical protein
VERYFKQGSVAVLMVFTAIIGAIALPFVWLFQPGVVALNHESMVFIAASGILYMSAIYLPPGIADRGNINYRTILPSGRSLRAYPGIFHPWGTNFLFPNNRRFADHCRIGYPFFEVWARHKPR